MTQMARNTPTRGQRQEHKSLDSPRSALGARSAQPGDRPLRTLALLPGLLAAVTLQGCLVPQSVDQQSNRVRFPPRVRIEAIDPKLSGAAIALGHGSIDTNAGCSCRLLLEVPQIEEEDPTVNLEVRWFLDYDPDKPATQRPATTTQTLQGSFDTTAIVRQGPKLEVDIGALGLTDGIHVVDMVVAEQGGFDDAATILPHKAVLTGYESAQQRFVVQVLTDNDKACRADSPWKRVCGSGP